MSKTGKYNKHVQLYMTSEMHDFVQLMASRQQTTMADVIRQAVRDQLDVQEDVIGSRSRLGVRVMKGLEGMQQRLLEQTARQGRLQLAAMIVLFQRLEVIEPGTLAEVIKLAEHPKIVKALGGEK